MSSLSVYLPSAAGLLPKWLLFISIVSIANSIQAYTSLGPTRRVYTGSNPMTVGSKADLPEGIPAKAAKSSPSPVTPLSARTFGTWTAITAIIRLYAAYHIKETAVYELALWSFGIAWLHFVSEWMVFQTTRLGPGLIGPLIVSTGSLVWMSMQRDYYLA